MSLLESGRGEASPVDAGAGARLREVRVSDVSADALVEAWNLAYTGYLVSVQRDAAQLIAHVRSMSVAEDRSFVFYDGDAPAALSLLAIRGGRRGWIGGFGVSPAYRGQGLAGRILRRQLDDAADAGVETVSLEVLEGNDAARHTYAAAGFEEGRRLVVLAGLLLPLDEDGPGPGDARWVDPGDLADPARVVDAAAGPWRPAWTREASHVLESDPDARLLVVGPDDDPRAVLVVTAALGGVAVIGGGALDDDSAAAAVALLRGDHELMACRVVNEPEGSPLHLALADAGVNEVMAQHEMAVDPRR